MPPPLRCVNETDGTKLAERRWAISTIVAGADKVFIARPYLWGLGGFGEDGVACVIDLLQEELPLVMKPAGVAAI